MYHKPSVSRARLAQLLAIAALTAGLALAFRASREPSLNLTYAQATRGELQREVLTSGTLEPAKEVETGSQVSGTIQALHADFNSRVTAGQIVAELDPSVYDTELAQARARVIQADAEAHHAQLAADDASVKAARARELAAGDLITRAELDAAGLAAKESAAALVAARAAAKAARAAQELAQVQRERTTIRSPIDGVVVSRNVEVGQTLAASFESPVLFRIADLRRMRLLVEVGEGEVGGVQTGTPVTFEIESLPGQQFKGTVAEVRLQPLVTQSGVGTGGAAGASQAQPTATSGASTASASSATVGGQQPASATAGSASRAQPSSAQGAASGGTQGSTSGTTQAPSPGTPTAPAGGVVSYTAIIDVDNSDHRITPGSSAVVTLPTARRSNAIRIPNNALSFRPAPDVLAATGQASLEVRPPDPSTDSAKGRERYVWKYEDGKFVPIAVRVGVSDERWTELIEGPIEEGVPLVTTAARAR